MIEQIDYKWALAGLAVLISICNFGYYAFGILKGRTKPHLYTWLIWSIVAFTVAAGQIFDGAGAGSLITLLAGINCLIVAMLSLFFGTKDITRSDTLWLITCFAALALWPLTKSPLWSVIIVTIIDLIGYIPTIRKSYYAPHEESIYIFLIFLVTCSLGLSALHNYTPTTMIYFIAMNVANFSMASMLIIRRYKLGHKILA